MVRGRTSSTVSQRGDTLTLSRFHRAQVSINETPPTPEAGRLRNGANPTDSACSSLVKFASLRVKQPPTRHLSFALRPNKTFYICLRALQAWGRERHVPLRAPLECTPPRAASRGRARLALIEVHRGERPPVPLDYRIQVKHVSKKEKDGEKMKDLAKRPRAAVIRERRLSL